MFNEDDGNPSCPECGAKFDNIFNAVEHMLEDDEDFDPSLILPGGYRLKIGSLLRSLYEHRDDPKMISDIVQSTYTTLFTAEFEPELINETVEDMIVESAMVDIDGELSKLFKNGE